MFILLKKRSFWYGKIKIWVKIHKAFYQTIFENTYKIKKMYKNIKKEIPKKELFPQKSVRISTYVIVKIVKYSKQKVSYTSAIAERRNTGSQKNNQKLYNEK